VLLKEPSPRIWADDRDTGTRNPTSEEEHAFWAWAIIELLRRSGIQVEELTELHLDPMPAPGRSGRCGLEQLKAERGQKVQPFPALKLPRRMPTGHRVPHVNGSRA